MYFIKFFIQLLYISIKGWGLIVFKAISFILKSFLNLPIIFKLNSMFIASQFYLSLLPWISYRINFTGEYETISIPPKVNLWVILLAGSNLIQFFFQSMKIYTMYVVIQSLICAILLLGFIEPNLVFVNFLNKEDYYLNYNGYSFITSALITTFLSIHIYFTKKYEI